MSDPAERDPRVYFAAERTLLAWIRTGLGLMGVGFAVSRFGLFLRQLHLTGSELTPHTSGLSVWSGIALVVLGILVNIGAITQHVGLIHELSSGTWEPGRISRNAIILAGVLVCFGVGMVIYLLLVR